MTPPRGPPHTPVNSPEAASACPAEREEAKKAREDLLAESGEARRQAQARAAVAVLAQAQCEHHAFTALTVDVASQAAMTERIKVVRRQYQDARNLYEEVDGYGDTRASVGAGAGLADLHEAFAEKIRALATPVDLVDPAGRAEWQGQMRELVASFEVEAALAASRALDAAAGVSAGADDVELGAWVKASCEKVARLDPEGLPRFTACR